MNKNISNQEKIDFFNYHSSCWKEYYDKSDFEKIEDLIRRCRFSPTETLLEVGCGAGCITPYILKYIKEGMIYSIDNSREMIKKAEEALSDPRVKFMVADAQKLPFENSFFSAILCFNCFPHISDKPASLEEFKRVLTDGGHFFIVHSISRQRVNQLHSETGGPIAHDFLPQPEKLHKMLDKKRFKRVSLDDGEDYFFLEYKLRAAGT